MKIFLLKHSYNIIYLLFIIGLYLVVFVRDNLDNELFVIIINYFFWFIFGLSTGVLLSKLIRKNIDRYNNQIDRNKGDN